MIKSPSVESTAINSLNRSSKTALWIVVPLIWMESVNLRRIFSDGKGGLILAAIRSTITRQSLDMMYR